MNTRRIRLIAAFSLALCLLSAGCFALAEGNVYEPEYEEVTIIEGTPAIDAGVNIRVSPSADSKKAGSMSPGDICSVTGKSNGWYSVVFNGVIGYIRMDLLTLSQRTELVEKIVEEPLAASCEGFDVPYMAASGAGFSVFGTARANIPIASVRLTVYDLRALKDEAVLTAKFTRDMDVREYDLSAFSGEKALKALGSGEKRVTVTVCSANEEAIVSEKRIYISGKCADEASLTSACDISVSRGSLSNLFDDSYSTSWSPSSAEDSIRIKLPEGRLAGGLLMEWESAPSHVEIRLFDEVGTEIQCIQDKNEGGKWNLYYALDDAVRAVVIRSGDKGNGICELRVFEKDRVAESVQRWRDAPEKIDLMLVVAHMNDETLYFSGTIPKLTAQGYNVLVVYMTTDTRLKHAEALDCLWTAGDDIHPVFVEFADYKVDTYTQAERLWGSERTYETLVGLIRKYKPSVVLTHDWNGEYGHQQHIMTSRYTVKSVEMAGNAEYFPDSADAWGVWDAPKTYLHMHDESKRLDLRFYDPMDALHGRSPMEMAFIAFDKHTSQLKRYSLRGDGVTYDCTWFALYRSLVGEDFAQDSFFENLP